MCVFTSGLVILIFTFHILAYSQYTFTNPGTAQLSLGGGNPALPWDLSSAWLNPSSLATNGAQHSLSTGILSHFSGTVFLDENALKKESTNPGFLPLPYIHAALQIDSSRWFAGAGTAPLVYSSIEWPDDWSGRFVITRHKQRIYALNGAIACQITDNWLIGLGITGGWQTCLFEKSLPLYATDSSISKMRFRAKGPGIGFNAGMQYKPLPYLTIGLSASSGLYFNNLKGEVEYLVPSSMAEAYPATTFSTSYRTPWHFDVAATYYLTRRTLFSAGVLIIRNGKTTPSGNDENPGLDTLMKELSMTNSSPAIRYSLALQYGLSEKVALRGSIGYHSLETNPETYIPGMLEGRNIYGSCGLVWYMKPTVAVEAGFQYGEGLKYRIPQNENFYGFGGNYRQNIINFAAGIIWSI